MSSNGFGQGFSSSGFSQSSGFNAALYKPASAAVEQSSELFSNFNSYITNGTRAVHGATAGAGHPAFLGVVTRVNVTLTVVLKVVSPVTVKGFKFVRTPEASGNWLTTTFDNMDAVLTVKSGGSINGGAISTKTFATNSKVRSATRTSPVTVNSYRNEYDLYTVYDANAVTLTAGTYNLVYRGVSTQIGVAVLWTANVPISTTTSIYPDPADSANTNYHPVLQILSTAP